MIHLLPSQAFELVKNPHLVAGQTIEEGVAGIPLGLWVDERQRRRAVETGSIFRVRIILPDENGAFYLAAADHDVLVEELGIRMASHFLSERAGQG